MATQPSILDYIKCSFEEDNIIAKIAPKKQYLRLEDGTIKVLIEFPSPKLNRIKQIKDIIPKLDISDE